VNGRTLALAAGLAAALALVASGCGGTGQSPASAAAKTSKASCPAGWRSGWQKLANRVGVPVYCPSWIPSPLTGDINGRWSTGAEVDKDRSYLVGFIWVEHGDEVHVNLRGYPGRTAIPKCVNEEQAGKRLVRTKVPCFSDPKWTRRMRGSAVTLYTVNRDADQWHLLFAWRRNGSLYALSEHVAPPFDYARVVLNLKHMYRSLVPVGPKT
jgi:hypothetical protein